MDSSLLKRACEAAGFLYFSKEQAGFEHVTHGRWKYLLNDPALPAYVASLLVAKVRERGGHGRAMWFALERVIGRQDRMFATDEQRIRAALDVLEGE